MSSRVPDEQRSERWKLQRRFVDELIERLQTTGIYGVVEVHLQAGEIVRTKSSRTEEIPRQIRDT